MWIKKRIESFVTHMCYMMYRVKLQGKSTSRSQWVISIFEVCQLSNCLFLYKFASLNYGQPIDMNDWAKVRLTWMIGPKADWHKWLGQRPVWHKWKFDMNESARGRFDMNEWAIGQSVMNESWMGQRPVWQMEDKWAKGQYVWNHNHLT